MLTYIQDSDTLLNAVRAWAPEAVKEIRTHDRDAKLNPLGRTGMNSFYCWEYGAPLHSDDDDCWSLCTTLFKKCEWDEYNFAYAQWGLYIVTEENCLWYVMCLLNILSNLGILYEGYSILTICMELFFRAQATTSIQSLEEPIPPSGAKIWRRHDCMRRLDVAMQAVLNFGLRKYSLMTLHNGNPFF